MEANLGWIVAAIGLMGTFLAWFVKTTVENSSNDLKESLRGEFGDRFLDAKLASAKIEPIERDLSRLSKHVDEVEDYAHTTRHELANEIQQCKLKLHLGRP